MEVNALRIGRKWHGYRGPGPGRTFAVHSVFARTVNLATGRELLSLVGADSSGSSSFLTLPCRKPDLGLKTGDPCAVRDGRLYLADLTVDFGNAPLWEGVLPMNFRGRVREENIAVFKAILDRKASPESAWRQVSGNPGGPFRRLSAILDLGESPEAARDLVGLGPGLTPSGDDMLVGYLAIAFHTFGDREFVRTLARTVRDLLPGTCDISAGVLENAAGGDFCEQVQRCVLDLCRGGKEDLYLSVASLLEIGASSGADIAAGMYAAMYDRRKNKSAV